jgi:hypothetical protein
MNVKKLIEKIEGLNKLYGEKFYVALDDVLDLVKQLDEPQKVVVPPFVSVWYMINKDNLYKNIAYLCANWVKSTNDDTLFNWMSNTDNFIEILVNMHKFGYEVEKEKEKRYRVKLKSNSEEIDYLVDTITNGFRFYSNIYTQRREHTRKQLEEADFGWVFDCEGIEIEEVEG